jgi:hypothetical protein
MTPGDRNQEEENHGDLTPVVLAASSLDFSLDFSMRRNSRSRIIAPFNDECT